MMCWILLTPTLRNSKWDFRLFGSAAATPNMHMQMHLTSVVKEYGPLYASGSLLSNGTMAFSATSTPNNRQIEGQIMARFLEAGLADSLQDEVPKEYEGHFPLAEVNEKGESQCC